MTMLAFGRSQCFARTVETGTAFARTDWPVLLLGETGVGKDLFARLIHNHSRRSEGPFVPVNCGAIPPGLFESELFGHERGAFSGAVSPSRGLFRQAHRGSLFLDEIGDLDFAAQVKLLRLLDSGEVRAVGGTKVERHDVRIIAATNIDLFTAAARGNFRHDLLERLSVLMLPIPPLRERKEDLPLIASKLSQDIGASLDASAIDALAAYSWPGNVRQLRNVLARASILSEGRGITGSILRPILREEERRKALVSSVSSDYCEGSLAEIEKRVIVERLRRWHGNRKRAAEELGIAKSTLHEKLRRWQEESPGEVEWPLSRLAIRLGSS